MGHKSKESLYMQMCESLEGMFTPCRSKHQDKATGETSGHIYSYETMKAYKKHCGYFLAYCKDKHRCRTLGDCKPFIKEWLETRQGLSAYTIKLEAASVAKLYRISTADRETFGETPARHRKDIKRSRYKAVRDSHFSEEKNRDIVSFCRSTGLRRKELKAVTGDCLIIEDGRAYVYVKRGKGGKPRRVPVIGDTDTVIRLMTAAGQGKVFPAVPVAMDVHSYRREYATAIYQKYARPIEVCKADPFYNAERGRCDRDSVYRFRKDRAGEWLDKYAMLEASRALGHNRISVVGEHYIMCV